MCQHTSLARIANAFLKICRFQPCDAYRYDSRTTTRESRMHSFSHSGIYPCTYVRHLPRIEYQGKTTTRPECSVSPLRVTHPLIMVELQVNKVRHDRPLTYTMKDYYQRMRHIPHKYLRPEPQEWQSHTNRNRQTQRK